MADRRLASALRLFETKGAKQQILISLSQPAISPSLPNKTTKANSPSPYADDIAADSVTGFVQTERELLLQKKIRKRGGTRLPRLYNICCC